MYAKSWENGNDGSGYSPVKMAEGICKRPVSHGHWSTKQLVISIAQMARHSEGAQKMNHRNFLQ